MSYYQERADQAIVDERWHEADDLLSRGMISTPHFDDACRIKLRQIALPLYRDVVNYENGRTSRLTDATIQEVHEETLDLLRTAHQSYELLQEDPEEHARKGGVYIGTLAEVGFMGLWTHARTHQIDEGLMTPALLKEDRASDARSAHDFNMYDSGINWNPASKTPIQLKHTAKRTDVLWYKPSVVVLGYTGDEEVRIGKTPAVINDSLNHKLRLGRDRELQDERFLNRRYRRVQAIARGWPKIRQRLSSPTPSSAPPLTQKLDLSRMYPPEAQENSSNHPG